MCKNIKTNPFPSCLLQIEGMVTLAKQNVSNKNKLNRIDFYFISFCLENLIFYKYKPEI